MSGRSISRRRTHRNAVLLVAATLTLTGDFAPAATRTWNTNSSASFNLAANWSPAIIPGSADLAVFRRGNGVTYNVFFPNGATITDQLRVGLNNVTFMPTGTSTYTLNNASLSELGRGIIVGDIAGGASDVSQLTISIGVSAAAATVGDVSGPQSSILNITNGTLSATGSGLNDHELIVGNLGTGTLNVSGTSSVNVPGALGDLILGRYASGVGIATISGSSASVTVGNQLDPGYAGQGALFINGGADVTSADTLIGALAGSSGSVQVINAGSTFTTTDSLVIGYEGEGSLAIEPGGSASGVQVHIASLAGSSGGLIVNGGTFTSTGFLGVGFEGSGTLGIQGAGTVTTDACFVASEFGSTANVEITGAGSSWTSDGLNLGERGSATVNISGGGSISADHIFIGNNSASSATVTVSGTGSTLNATVSGLFVGNSGDAQLNVLAGADVNTTGFCNVGSNATSVSTVTLDGAGSLWTNNGAITVGASGDGTMNIQAGADVTDTNGTVGSSTGGIGEVLVTGAGSTWVNSGTLIVGDSGSGTLTIQNGGNVSASGLTSIGRFTNGVGVVTVNGSGSLFSTPGSLVVGGQFNGNGTLLIQNGGDAVSGFTSIGNGATGVVTVNGAGSTFNTGQVNVSTDGIATFNIENGASVTSSFVNIGTFATDAVGTVNVSGTGSSWTVNNELRMARDGATGTLNVMGGTVTLNSNLLDQGENGSSFVNITGGTMTINGHYAVNAAGAGTTTLTLDGGTLDMTNHVIGHIPAIDVLNFRSGTLKNVLQINNAAGLTKTTSGTLTLEGIMTYGGPTNVNAGTLVCNTRLLNSSSLNIANAALVRIATSIATPSQLLIRTNSLTTNTTGKIDLRDNKVVVASGTIGTWNGSAYTGLTGMVQSGRGDGSWNGAGGILTTMTDATTGVLTTVAIALASDTQFADDVFSGVGVGPDDVLIMYTWGGDADLNGELNGDDYFYLDSNVLQNGSVFGFHNGDFNYDGALNGDDYFILDSNILQAQASAPFPTSAGAGLAGLSAIPEPAALSLLSAVTLLTSRRRSR